MSEVLRKMTAEVRQDDFGPVFMLSAGADDPLRRQIVESVANLLDSHGRWVEATNMRASANWGPQLTGEQAAAAAGQSFGVDEEKPAAVPEPKSSGG
jgi:hypothetical protein